MRLIRQIERCMRYESTHEIEKRTGIQAPFFATAAKAGTLKAELVEKGERDVWRIRRDNLEIFLLSDAAGVNRYRAEMVPLSALQIDKSLNLRADFCPATVEAYARDLAAGIKLPPVVFLPDLRGAVIDGAHTLLAAKKAGLHSIEAIGLTDIMPDEARMIGVARNRTHGRPWTQADKRRILEAVLSDPDRSGLSLREIGEIAGVSHMTVDRALKARANQAPRQPSRSERTPVEIGREHLLNAIAALRPGRPDIAAELEKISRELAG